jgi:hypothetical protein
MAFRGFATPEFMLGDDWPKLIDGRSHDFGSGVYPVSFSRTNFARHYCREGAYGGGQRKRRLTKMPRELKPWSK